MKFLYEYKTPQNERRSGEISASSREDVFSQLKREGIKPFNVKLAPGLLNRVASIGKRWFAIAILSVLLVGAGVFAFVTRTTAWVPSDEFAALRNEAELIVAEGTNDYLTARADLRRLFTERLDRLSSDPREREAAMALYGELALRLDDVEASDEW